ncbi:MAG: tetratricopeptide repeat protein, partial [Candidatus Eisenbacteria bacterium]|nr:tetratricopeptide repeat protein [Candidatus Eisenbacteria bacterium]
RRGAIVVGNLGILFYEKRDFSRSRKHLEKALELAQKIQNRRFEGHVLGNLGILHFEENRFEDASLHYRQALQIHRDVGNRRGEGIVLSSLGTLHLAMDRPEEARAYLELGIKTLRQVGDLVQLGKVLCARGFLACDESDGGMARTCLVEAKTIAADLTVTAESELGREIARLAERLDSGT